MRLFQHVRVLSRPAFKTVAFVRSAIPPAAFLLITKHFYL
jgi:hypothetical protein